MFTIQERLWMNLVYVQYICSELRESVNKALGILRVKDNSLTPSSRAEQHYNDYTHQSFVSTSKTLPEFTTKVQGK